ncbi:MAG: ester cyclase [Burkholderiaceae bacterium]
MSDTKPIDIVMKLHDLWNGGAIERIPVVYSPKFIAHMPRGWEHSEFIGHDGARQLVGRIRTAFPDWHERVVDVVADGKRVVTRYVSTDTHPGFLGTMPPTGRAVVVDEISIYLVQNYLVTEQ